jgi:hypothetical protein
LLVIRLNGSIRSGGKKAWRAARRNPSLSLGKGRLFTGGRIPYNSTVDVTRGTLALRADVGTLTVRGADRLPAVFELARSGTKTKPIVELRLAGGNFNVCPKRKPSSVTGVDAKTTTVRQIWGNGKGAFRTRGKYASAAVRGTNWLTSDRCDGTRVRVVRGVVSVSDFAKRKVVAVRAGSSYLAKP